MILGAFGFGVVVVGFDVFDEDGEVLGSEASLCGAGASARACDHDVRVAKVHLGAAGLAVAEVLGEAEDAGEPRDGGCNVLIDDVGEDRIGGDGTIRYHAGILPDKLIVSISGWWGRAFVW